MFLLPRVEFTIQTDLTPDEVRWRLFRQIQPETDTRRRGRGRRFEGRIDGNRFELEQVKGWGRDVFPPTIIGEIKPRGRGAIVNVKAEVDPLSGTAMLLWLGILAIIAIGFTFVAFKAQQFGLLFCPAGLVIIAYGLFVFAFELEISVARQFLEDLVAPDAQWSTATAVLTNKPASRLLYGGRQGAQRYGTSIQLSGHDGVPTGEYDTQKFPPKDGG